MPRYKNDLGHTLFISFYICHIFLCLRGIRCQILGSVTESKAMVVTRK